MHHSSTTEYALASPRTRTARRKSCSALQRRISLHADSAKFAGRHAGISLEGAAEMRAAAKAAVLRHIGNRVVLELWREQLAHAQLQTVLLDEAAHADGLIGKGIVQLSAWATLSTDSEGSRRCAIT